MSCSLNFSLKILIKIGFSKFAELRPKHCVLAGSSGTYTVCVCTHHENVKLMLKATKLKYLGNDPETSLNDYRDCLKLTMCPDATSSCHLGECKNCPGITKIKSNLIDSCEDEGLQEIKFNSWLQTDRCTYNSLNLDVDDFANELCEQLLKFRTHDFICNQQTSFIKNLKTTLKNDEFII